MCLTEFDEVKYANYIREEGREEGENLLASLMTKLFAAGRTSDAELAAKDENARKRLYKEFEIK